MDDVTCNLATPPAGMFWRIEQGTDRDILLRLMKRVPRRFFSVGFKEVQVSGYCIYRGDFCGSATKLRALLISGSRMVLDKLDTKHSIESLLGDYPPKKLTR